MGKKGLVNIAYSTVALKVDRLWGLVLSGFWLFVSKGLQLIGESGASHSNSLHNHHTIAGFYGLD